MDIIFGKPLLITVGDDEEYFLYKDGNLCTSKSGGWTKGFVNKDSQPPTFREDDNAPVTFQSDSILINPIPMGSDIYCGIRNGRDINFNLFQNIEIEYSSSGGAYDQIVRDAAIVLPNNQILKLKGSATTTTEGFSLTYSGSGRIMIYHRSRNTNLIINSINLIRK